MAEFFRSLVELEFEQDGKRKKKTEKEAWKEFFKLAGIGDSGLRDVSAKHDRYLANDELGGWKR